MVISIISRTPSLSQITLTRLLIRLHASHPKRKEISEQSNKIEAGFAGEQLVDRSILEIEFPKDLCIFPDLQLKIHEHLFIQLDTLIITRKYFLIIEVKNMVGTITFQKHQEQVIRSLDGVSTAFECPIIQTNRHIYSLERLGIPLPIFKGIVYSSNRVILENVPPDEPIFFRKNLPMFIQSLNKKEDLVNTIQFKKIINNIQSRQVVFQRKALCDQWKINPSTLIKGLFCKNCSTVLSKLTNKTWKCTQCEAVDLNPIKHNIDDYFLLIKDSISTAECKDFFGLSSSHEAYYMLKKCNLISVNHGKRTVYRKKV
ncbi:nuclease-related domain-containing protein [Psychrobacillus sp. FJAT-51614]|uniref:Nuclease-related domain-containing protein n=1 Tax=Psychrobacillus mangrovi TaxID=3117745 RepID=A0ABU8F5T3_9BACI